MIYDLNRYLFCRKQGAAVPVIMGVTGLLGAVGSAASYDASMTANSEENQKNRIWSSEENQKNRDFQDEQRQLQQNFAQQFWYNQFNSESNQWYNQQNFLNDQWKIQQDYSNQQAYSYWLKQQLYNSPSAMVGRLNSAGLNAAAAINAQQFGSSGLSAAPTGVVNSSVPSPSVGVGSPASGSGIGANVSPIASPTNAASAFSQMSDGISSLISSVAKAGKDSVEMKQVQTMLAPMLTKAIKDIESVELSNSYQAIQNYVAAHSKDMQIQRFDLDLQKLSAEILLSRSNVEYFKEKTVTERFNALLTDYSGRVKNQEFLQMVMLTDRYSEILENQVKLGTEKIATEKSQQAFNYASSYERSMAAKLHISEKALRESETNLTDLKSVFQTLDNGIKANQFKISDIGLEVVEFEKAIQKIEKAQKLEDIQNDWNLWNFVRRVKNQLGFDMNVGVGIHN